MPSIHPSALIDPAAELAEDVKIGPGVVIEGKVSIGPRTVIHAHSILQGSAEIGADCRIGPAAYVGLEPQHLGYRGEETWLILGDGCVVRETAQIHRAMKPGRENGTFVGKRCFLMAAAHIAHDSRVGDDVVLANGSMLGGHCLVGDRVFLGGGSKAHQFVRIGRVAMIAGNESISRDVLPFAAVRYGGLKGYNAVGCRRAGLDNESIHAVRAAFRSFHSHRTTAAAVAAIQRSEPLVDAVKELLEFIRTSKRGLHQSIRFLSTPDPFEED